MIPLIQRNKFTYFIYDKASLLTNNSVNDYAMNNDITLIDLYNENLHNDKINELDIVKLNKNKLKISDFNTNNEPCDNTIKTRIQYNHAYDNIITSKISTPSLFDSNYPFEHNDNAVNELKEMNEYNNFNISFDWNIFDMYMFYFVKTVKENEKINNYLIKITLIGVKTDILNNYNMITNIINKQFVISLCNRHILYSKKEIGLEIYDKCDEINDNHKQIIKLSDEVNSKTTDGLIEQPSFLKSKLYNFQLKNIKWMLDKEINNKIYFKLNNEIVFTDTFYDFNMQNFYKIEQQKYIEFSGGALIDSVGLGKTVQMITLSLLNKPSNINYCQNKYKKPFSRATLILCPSQIACQWIKELKAKINKDVTIRIIQIFTKTHYEKYTYQDLLDADFVVITHDFLKNQIFLKDFINGDLIPVKMINYTLGGSYYRTKNSSKAEYTRGKLNTTLFVNKLEKITNEMKNNILKYLLTTCANPLYIHWNRIIIDEFHEISVVKKYLHIRCLLPLLSSNYNWCVTGTPFPDKVKNTLDNSVYDNIINDDINDIDNTIDNTIDTNNTKKVIGTEKIVCLTEMIKFITKRSVNIDMLKNPIIYDKMINGFFRKNTQKSIKDEYSIPDPYETTIWLDFSKSEWMLYNSYLADSNLSENTEIIRQLCCCPKIVDELKNVFGENKTLDDIEDIMLEHYKNQVDYACICLTIQELLLKRIELKIKINRFKKQEQYLTKINYIVNTSIDELLIEDDKYKKMLYENRELRDNKRLKLNNNNNNDNINNDHNDDIDIDYQIEVDDYKNNNIIQKNKNNGKIIIVSDTTQDEIQKIIGYKYTEIENSLSKYYVSKKNAMTKYNKIKSDYDGKISRFKYYDELIKRLKLIAEKTNTNNNNDEDDNNDNDDDENNEDNECPICLDDIDIKNTGVTKCGHVFCFNCIETFVKQNPTCPSCKSRLCKNDLYKIQSKINETDNVINTERDKLINKVGTKIANLILYLIKNKDKHVIIFSQWDSLLTEIGHILNIYMINNLFCKGNVWQRNKIINEFNVEENIKVLMLSSESAASGTNLTKADTIIILEPIMGSYEYRKSMENQAIGRACRIGQKKSIEIVRFIVKGTIEEKIYNTNKNLDKKYGTNKKINEYDDKIYELEQNVIGEINERNLNDITPKKKRKNYQ